MVPESGLLARFCRPPISAVSHSTARRRAMVNVAVIVGSLRRESINRKVVLALQKLAKPRGLDLGLVELGDLPQYNEDLWADPGPPAAVTRLKRAVEAADAVLLITPEYNRGVPG